MKHDKTNSIKLRLFLLFKRIYLSLFKLSDLEKQTVLVSGMQRSGTNMLMKVLDYSLQTDVYHETDVRAFDNFEMRNIKVIRRLLDSCKAPLFIIKSLCELQNISQLMNEFQPAKTIWIVRNYDDVSNSVLASFKKNIVSRIVRVVKQETDEWLAAGMSQQTKQHLEHCVHLGMNEVSAAAAQWYFRNILFFEQNLHDDDNVLLVSYEQLVSQPVKEVKRICQFLGITFSQRMSDDIFSASISRRKKPNIDPEVRGLCEQLMARFDPLFVTNTN